MIFDGRFDDMVDLVLDIIVLVDDGAALLVLMTVLLLPFHL